MDEYEIQHPHDALLRGVFADPELAGELLRGSLAAEICQRIDWTTLCRVDGTFIDDSLRGHHADLLFSAMAGSGPALLYVLLEHKAEQDRFTAFQLLRYIVRIWERWREDHPDAQQLPPVVPLVLHHGRRPWQGPRDLSHLIRLAGLPEQLVLLQPSLCFALEDLTAQGEADVRAKYRSVRTLLPLLHLQWLRRAADTMQLLLTWLDDYRRLLDRPDGQEIAKRLASFVAAVSDEPPERLRKVYREVSPTMEKHYMSTADQILRQGREQGMRQGVRQGTAQTLLRQLGRRFGPLPAAIVEHVANATAAELDRIADAVLIAASLDDLFAPGG